MIRLASRYPDGAPGLSMLLRLGCACAAISVGMLLAEVASGLAFALAAMQAGLLVLGLVTRTAALLLGISIVAMMVVMPPQWLLAGHVGACMALAILGAGAFSLDAIRHGRRVIQLPLVLTDRPDED